MKKWSLIVLVLITALLQLIWGIWILLDLESLSRIFLEATIQQEILINTSFVSLSGITSSCFLMLSGYSFLTVILIIKKSKIGAILALITGTMITIISVFTFISAQSPIVLLTDTLRGVLIVLFSILYIRGDQ